MKKSYSICFVLLLTISCSSSSALLKDENPTKNFVKCLNRYSADISDLVYTQESSNFTQTLLSTINNLRFAKPETPKPLVIVRPVSESQIQTVIFCSRKHDLQMRIRSGGHSFEGLSYVSPLPFVILDIINLKTFTFDAKTETAWIGSGLTNGELYYRIGQKSDTLGFPSGLWANVAVAPKFPKELEIKADGQCILSDASPRADKKTMIFLFEAMYLGGADQLLSVMQEQLPELGVVREDCFEVNFLQAGVYFSGFPLFTPPEILLNLTILPRPAFKSNNDYTKEPIPVEGLEGIWDLMYKLPPQKATLQFTPYGGRMDEISESALPFPYRAGTWFKFNMFAETDTDEADRIEWIRNITTYLTPYVTSNPRSSYVNYVNLWLGTNNLQGPTSYQQASKWGKRYFRNNFDRLVRIKTMVDPGNFFRHEQSIPPLSL
ncbi:hypothetical protein ACET3Z_013575 [Daucus carota]